MIIILQKFVLALLIVCVVNGTTSCVGLQLNNFAYDATMKSFPRNTLTHFVVNKLTDFCYYTRYPFFWLSRQPYFNLHRPLCWVCVILFESTLLTGVISAIPWGENGAKDSRRDF